jgi:hypothetical protein
MKSATGNILGPDMPLLNHMPHPSQEDLHVLGSRVVPGVITACLVAVSSRSTVVGITSGRR